MGDCDTNLLKVVFLGPEVTEEEVASASGDMVQQREPDDEVHEPEVLSFWENLIATPTVLTLPSPRKSVGVMIPDGASVLPGPVDSQHAGAGRARPGEKGIRTVG